MKVLIIGSGGREHALAWKIVQSPDVKDVVCAPGNAGIARTCRVAPVKAEDIDGIMGLAADEKPDLVVVGPEAPLVQGLSERLAEKGIRVFGPGAKAAMLEGSKVFAKEFMKKHSIPTADFTVHDTESSALDELKKLGDRPVVVKADGLAAGKGVFVCSDSAEAADAVKKTMGERVFGDAGERVIIEERLEGEEVSMLALVDGENLVPLIPAQDHKAAYDGDRGPNTGGMGAYAPAPVADAALKSRILEEILQPVVRGMAEDGTPFKGVLYGGLMVTQKGPQVLEFNVRFGDPEAQPILKLMKDDIVPYLVAAAEGNIKNTEVEWHDGSTLCVVLAAQGYPGSYEKGKEISGIDEAEKIDGVTVFHAGTSMKDNRLVTSGGRVLGVTALGVDLEKAAELAYTASDMIKWEGVRFRKDIGFRALGR